MMISATDPHFAPQSIHTSSTLVFVGGETGSNDIYTLEIKDLSSGTTRTKIIEMDPRCLVDWPSVESNPRWSPDGQQIAFLSNKGHEGQKDVAALYVMSADGSGIRKLADRVVKPEFANYNTFVWHPHKPYILFAKQSLMLSFKNYLSYINKPTINNTFKMALAANLSGKAISITKTTAPHALSYPFTAHFNISHGHAVSLTLNDFMKLTFNITVGLLLSGTIVAVIFGYLVRFLALSFGTIEAGLTKVTPNMDGAARTLGQGPGATLRRVHLPMIKASILTAGILVFVDCMKELPITILLRPFNYETLATYVHQFASDGLLEESALGAVTIVAAGILPVIILSRTIRFSRPGSKQIQREVDYQHAPPQSPEVPV